MADFLTGAGVVFLIFFLLTIFIWRWLTMWFFGTREIVAELRALRQEIAHLRLQQPATPTIAQPGAPAVPAPIAHSTPVSAYTPPTPVYNPAQMSSTPPPGWTGRWDPDMFRNQK